MLHFQKQLTSIRLLNKSKQWSTTQLVYTYKQNTMGNKTFSLEFASQSTLPSFLRPIKHVYIQHFGSVQVFYDSEQKIQVFMKQYNFMYEGESKYRFTDNIKGINQNNPYLVRLVRLIESTGGQDVCSKTNKIICFFQYHPITLKIMIQQRKLEAKPFQEKQVLWFLNCLLKGSLQLNIHGNYHGDINPQFLYWNERNNHLLMFDSVFFDTTKAGYYRAKSGNSYISPQILNNLAQKRTFPNFNPYKSDVFSIGMVILYCLTLNDPLLAYDMSKFSIEGYYIQNSLRIASKKYSQVLISIIRRMLSQRIRPTSKQLIDELIKLRLITQDIDRSNKSDRTSFSY